MVGSYKAVIFDLDGTLVDSAPDITQAMNLLLEHCGHEQRFSDTEITLNVGNGARVLIQKVWQQLDLDTPNEQQLDELLTQFRRLYYPICSEKSVLYEGVFETLELLSRKGFKMAVCTNKPAHHAEKMIDDYGLGDFVEYCCGGDTYEVRKPDSLPLLKTIERLGVQPNDCCFVGDSEVDHQTAQRSGVNFIFLDFGYHNGYSPSKKVTNVCSRFSDILDHINVN